MNNQKDERPVLLGRLFPSHDMEMRRLVWSFYEYTPNDKETFPHELIVTSKGQPYKSPTAGQLHVLENGDSLVLYLDIRFQAPRLSGLVLLDFGDEPNDQVEVVKQPQQFISNVWVRGIPLNYKPEAWLDFFMEEHPATLTRVQDMPLQHRAVFVPKVEEAVRMFRAKRAKDLGLEPI